MAGSSLFGFELVNPTQYSKWCSRVYVGVRLDIDTAMHPLYQPRSLGGGVGADEVESSLLAVLNKFPFHSFCSNPVTPVS